MDRSDESGGNSIVSAEAKSAPVDRIPQFQRDVFPANLVLSAKDLADFCRIVIDANERAKVIEFSRLDLSTFKSSDEARSRVNDLVQVEYNYKAANGDSVMGLGVPKVDDHLFPDELLTFYISNSDYVSRALKAKPLNVVEAFISFDKPSLKIDLQTFPSNPTQNKSVINVYGRDEDWVISTTSRIQEFLNRKKAFRPVIHGSGVYDYFIYLAFLPAVIWLLWKRGGGATSWLEDQSIFLNVVVAIYFIFISLLFARFIFQYFRWLFPPMEYFKSSRTATVAHRLVFGAVSSAIVLNALYDIAKGAIVILLGG